jgi:hypothetical protein
MINFLAGFAVGTGLGRPLINGLLKRYVSEKRYNEIIEKLKPLATELIGKKPESVSPPTVETPAAAIHLVPDDGEEVTEIECANCHRILIIDVGSYPTKYCHECAQYLVMQYEAAFLSADEEIDAMPFPQQWPIEEVTGVTHVYPTVPVDEFRDQALSTIRELSFRLGLVGMDEAVSMIANERQRQIYVEGWTPEHDDAHQHGELAKHAAALAIAHTDAIVMDDGEQVLPWKEHPSPRSLVIAGALIAAELSSVLRTSSVTETEEVPA